MNTRGYSSPLSESRGTVSGAARQQSKVRATSTQKESLSHDHKENQKECGKNGMDAEGGGGTACMSSACGNINLSD